MIENPVKHFSLNSAACLPTTFKIPFYINPCCVVVFGDWKTSDSFSKWTFFFVSFSLCRKRQMMLRGALHFARKCLKLLSMCAWCTIFTAIYGFKEFVNIILMFNETIINQIVWKSKIATMTFSLAFDDECSTWKIGAMQYQVFPSFDFCNVVIAI